MSRSNKKDNFLSLNSLKKISIKKINKEININVSDIFNRFSVKEYVEIKIWWMTLRIIKYPIKSLKNLSKNFMLGIDSIRKFT